VFSVNQTGKIFYKTDKKSGHAQANSGLLYSYRSFSGKQISFDLIIGIDLKVMEFNFF